MQSVTERILHSQGTAQRVCVNTKRTLLIAWSDDGCCVGAADESKTLRILKAAGEGGGRREEGGGRRRGWGGGRKRERERQRANGKQYKREMLPAGGSKAVIDPRRPPNFCSLKYSAAVQ